VEAGCPGRRYADPVADVVFVQTGLVPYALAWERQRQLHAQRVRDEIPDTCLLLEHPSIYTAGRGTRPIDRPLATTPVLDVDRGGKITWHGPGQLTGYPIVKLPPLGGGVEGRDGIVDVVAHVRRLEEALIRVCADYGVAAERVAGRSGVWVRAPGVPDRKVAAIGVRVSRGVTMHGFALNADPDLTAYDRIVPCGIRDATVTSLSALTGRRIGVADVLSGVEVHLRAVLGAATGTRRLEPAHG
jgi:lipoyl(octanoyl) transferase